MGAGLWPSRATLGARGRLCAGLCHWCWSGCIAGGMVVVMTDKEAMKLALDALQTLMIEHGSIYDKAITALKEALAQPEQEPVAWMSSSALISFQIDRERYPLGGGGNLSTARYAKSDHHNTPLYTTPPQRTEQNFCSRCGKRTPDLITIHTCTPPREGT